MTTEPYDESVRDAVAREAARRKRVLLAFIGLLLVPMAIGAYALTTASTEKEQLVTDVTPIVAQRVGDEIASSVTNDVVARTQPLIQQNVSRHIAEVVEPRITSVAGALRTDITTLETSVQQTSRLVAGVAPQLAALPALENRIATLGRVIEGNTGALKADQERLRQDVTKQRDVTAGLSQRFERASAQMQATNANNEAIAALTRQMTVMQREMQRLQNRVTELERKQSQPVIR